MLFYTFALAACLIAKIFAEPAAADEALKKKKPCAVSSSDDCGAGCGACTKNYITKMDFYHVYPVLSGANKNWSNYRGVILQAGVPTVVYTADDGSFSTSCKGGVVDSTVFDPAKVGLSQSPQFQDLRYVILADKPADIPKNGDLVIEFEGSTETFKVNESPYPNQVIEAEDFRAASGIFVSADIPSGLAMAFTLTNDRVYAVYSRLITLTRPLDPTAPGFFASFVFVVPVKMRNACDIHNMKVVWHGASKQVSWRLEGREVFRVTKVGYLLDRQYMVVDNGGQEAPVFPNSVTYGFGTTRIIDAYPACKRSDVCCDCQFPTLREALANTRSSPSAPQYNPLLGPQTPAVFYYSETDPAKFNPAMYAWGQGAVVKIQKLVVYQDYCAH